MSKSIAGLQLHALLLAACMAAPLSALAGVPANGTNTITAFCGEVYNATHGMTNYGVKEDHPYIGVMELIQEPPEDPAAGTTQWFCDQNIYACGTISITLPGFVPPGTDPLPSDIFGPVELIEQTETKYELTGNLDGFVADPIDPTVLAIGVVDITMLCSTCPAVNNKQSIKPDYQDQFSDIAGDMAISVRVPGIGGSAAPPEGNLQEVNASILRLGGACNNILPATSSWGLVGLVGLLVVTSIFFAGRAASNRA